MNVLQFIHYTQRLKKLCVYIGFGIQLWIELMFFLGMAKICQIWKKIIQNH